MISRISHASTRRIVLAISAVALGAAAATARAADAEKPAYTLSLSAIATSHNILYGADTWAGGHDASPFSSHSTIFGDANLTLAVADNVSVFVDIWSDINNNVDSPIGGNIQEIDFNAGVVFTLDKFSITLSHGFWNYLSDQEKVADLIVGYNDMDKLAKGFALNPSVDVHWRYEGNNGQDCGVAIVPGIKPSFTLMSDGKYPLSIAFPFNVGFYTSDGFQGGDSGYGYFSAGASVSVPLAFIPAKYGAWNVSGSVTYYNTSTDAIPNNPEENFFVTTLGIGMTF